MKTPTSKTPVKEFMEWFVSEYEGRYLPSELDPTIFRLDGYCTAKGTEATIHRAALQHLRDFQTLLTALKRMDWKYTNSSESKDD